MRPWPHPKWEIQLFLRIESESLFMSALQDLHVSFSLRAVVPCPCVIVSLWFVTCELSKPAAEIAVVALYVFILF